jgi:hypothetical protein
LALANIEKNKHLLRLLYYIGADQYSEERNVFQVTRLAMTKTEKKELLFR